MPVVDSSVLVEYLAGGEHAKPARARLLTDRHRLWAPHLVDAEVGHVLRRGVMLGELRPSAATEALQDLGSMPLKRAGHIGLLDRAWSLRDNVSFYDALYIALAEQLGMPLLTLDARLQAAPGVRAAIEIVA
ncbi:MAG: type II toxin-antitoxin system VapC family toxin [Solirubrobacteraceae bacterium]